MKAVAIKKGQTKERAPAFKEMGTLRCDGCGEEFIIFHEPTFVDNKAAARQAQWLERFLLRKTNGNGGILIALNFQTSLPAGHMSVNAFHEKAGRSQVNLCFFTRQRFLLAESPLSPCFHTHS